MCLKIDLFSIVGTNISVLFFLFHVKNEEYDEYMHSYLRYSEYILKEIF